MAQAQDARDPYTAGHSERVSLTRLHRQMMGLRRKRSKSFGSARSFMTSARSVFPTPVLRKPGRLTREEYALIQRHPEIGREILEKVGRFKEFLPIVELHHENPDGSGYPYGLRNRTFHWGYASFTSLTSTMPSPPTALIGKR